MKNEVQDLHIWTRCGDQWINEFDRLFITNCWYQEFWQQMNLFLLWKHLTSRLIQVWSSKRIKTWRPSTAPSLNVHLLSLYGTILRYLIWNVFATTFHLWRFLFTPLNICYSYKLQCRNEAVHMVTVVGQLFAYCRRPQWSNVAERGNLPTPLLTLFWSDGWMFMKICNPPDTLGCTTWLIQISVEHLF